jgi:uncharacterized DUF497 family protein
VSLSLAAALDWSVESVLYYVAFVDRDGTLRVISLRKASRQEVLEYVQRT